MLDNVRESLPRPEVKSKYIKQPFSESVIGSSHIDKGKPNQDAVLTTTTERGNCLLAIADGHGGSKYEHSDQGSNQAVKTMSNALSYLERIYYEQGPEKAKDYFAEEFKTQLIGSWQAEISATTGEEWQTLSQEELEKFGSTVAGVAQIDNHLFFASLGDTDLTVVRTKKGDWSPTLTEIFSSDVGDDTESVCMPKASKYVKTKCKKINKPYEKLMVICSTDGLRNSYLEGGYEKFVRNTYKIEKEKVRKNMKSWLEIATKEGCGDDISVAILWMEKPFDQNTPW